MSREQFLNRGEKLSKESLSEEYERLRKEVEETNRELNEQQKEFSPDNAPSADFYAAHALAEHKIRRIKELETQLRKEKEK